MCVVFFIEFFFIFGWLTGSWSDYLLAPIYFNYKSNLNISEVIYLFIELHLHYKINTGPSSYYHWLMVFSSIRQSRIFYTSYTMYRMHKNVHIFSYSHINKFTYLNNNKFTHAYYRRIFYTKMNNVKKHSLFAH